MDDKPAPPNTNPVTYHFSPKAWANQIGLQYWPGYVFFIIAISLGLFTRYSDPAFYILLFSVLVLFFCYFVTRFYANAVLTIDESGLTVTQKENVKQFNWADISKIVFMVPSHGAAYLEIVIAVFDQHHEVDYIVVESLNFKWANARAGEVGYLVEKYFKGYVFKIHRSTFYAPLMMKRRDILPTIYP